MPSSKKRKVTKIFNDDDTETLAKNDPPLSSPALSSNAFIELNTPSSGSNNLIAMESGNI
jgi:hypothetical protein